MDGLHFDAIAKVLNETGSRRRALGLLGSTLALISGIGEGADAHDSWSRCKNIPSQKKQKKCIKKGKIHKKWHENNACRGEGQRCGDLRCCNGLSCNNGYCRPPSTCPTLRQSCSGATCCNTDFGSILDDTYEICEDNYCEGVVCCRTEGNYCSDNCDCCAGFDCIGGTCGSHPTGGAGAQCTAKSDCFMTPDESFSCSSVCESYNTCCWNETWGYCEHNCDCCGSLLCLLQSDGHKYCMYPDREAAAEKETAARDTASTRSTRSGRGTPRITEGHRSPEA